MNSIPKTEDDIFEDEVRRIAREIWPSAEFAGAAIHGGKERDGVFVTDECIHIVEATTSRAKYKAEKDGEKLASLALELSKTALDRVTKCYFVTKYEPTAEQRDALKKYKYPIYAMSFAQLQQKLINVPDYLTLRDKYAFGSARDPATNDIAPQSGFIPLDLLELQKRQSWSLEKIKNSILTGSKVHVLGDFGAGKSMTLREIYRLLRADYFKQTNEKFPIYINLRDHQGQTNPAEAFLRHATNLGFKHPDHLVRAWRAGYAVLILDGFDEIGTTGWAGKWKKLQSLRFQTMELVRRFVEETPTRVGLLIAGRAHYFDSDSERKRALSSRRDAIEAEPKGSGCGY